MSVIALNVPELGPVTARFHQLVHEEGLHHIREREWRTARREQPEGPELVATHDSVPAGLTAGAARLHGGLLAWQVRRGRVTVLAASAEPDALQSLLSHATRLFPRAVVPEPQQLEVTLWSCSRYEGGDSFTRTVTVPDWDAIASNYAADPQLDLDLMHRTRVTGEDGRLLLWHGPPGTGKTHAIRSLGWAWREWCDLHYVIDPERLLGDRPDYLIDVLAREQEDADARWSLLVLEDTGELLHADARERADQGLARFLNVLDGLLGQGTRTLVLLTTNEDIGTLHPAVVRPGRCAAQVAFAPLDAPEATAWRAAHNVDPGNSQGGVTLAELYAEAKGRDATAAPAAIGFR